MNFLKKDFAFGLSGYQITINEFIFSLFDMNIDNDVEFDCLCNTGLSFSAELFYVYLKGGRSLFSVYISKDNIDMDLFWIPIIRKSKE